MAEITAGLVKELREKTGAGMMDCKKALNEVNGNLEEAIDWLRKKGLAAAAKKAGRVAAEGLVGVAAAGTSGVVVEINAETDFVARNESFQAMVKKVSEIALGSNGTVETLANTSYPGEGDTVQGHITHLISVIGENMNLRRVRKLSVQNGVVATYMHSAVAPGIGKIGVLVALESSAPQDKLQELGRKIAMHIAATQPVALSSEEVDPALLERERNVLIDQARASGRPEDIIQKMVEGRIRKYYEEVVLLEQPFVMDPSMQIKSVVEAAAKEFGSAVKLTAFERFMLGDGIEKQESDFAAEVKAQAGV